MATAPPPAAEPTLPSYGFLGSTWAFTAVPLGRTIIKISRSLAANVEFLEPPVALGLEGAKWERDRATEPLGYMFKAKAADLAELISLEDWRGQLQSQFPDRMISDRRSAGTKQVTDFARQLFKLVSILHAAGWRLGLLHPKAMYIRASDPALIVWPDLGFAWVGTIEAVKPNWLKDEPEDAAWWGEARLHRQYAAPAHLKRHPKAAGGADFIQQDLHTVAQLLKYLITGSVAVALPAKCPLGAVVANVGQRQYATADAMWDDLRTKLKAPEEAPPMPAKGRPKSMVLASVAVAAVALAGAGLAAWFLLKEPSTDRAAVASNGNTEPTTTSPTTPATKPPPPNPATVKELVDEIDQAKTLEAAGRAAAKLAAKDPNHPKVAQTREKLLSEIRATWIIAKQDGHVPGRSMILNDLYKQLTPPKPQ